MLKMGRVQDIRQRVLVEGRSIRWTARTMGISRNTVRRYLKESEPKRVEPAARPRPVLQSAQARMDELLCEWGTRTTAKQRITGSRLHQELLHEGLHIGITTVREYLAELKRRDQEVFIPLEYRPGEVAQVDFFEVTVDVAGQRQAAWEFLMRLPFSGKDFAWIYERCNQIAFLDGHVRAYQYLGGVAARGVYDNLAAAVKRRLGLEVQLTDRFRALASHYLFEPCFTRRGEGHDKGSVEARGKGVRLQHLSPIPRGDSLAAISTELLARLETAACSRKDRCGRSVAERFEQERGSLRPLPHRPFDPRLVQPVVASRQALVRVEGADYSLPSSWASLQAMAFVGVADIRFECRGETLVVAKVPRGGRRIEYRHYLKELARKPQAVRQVAPKLLEEMGLPYQRLWDMIAQRYGGLEAARVVAKLLGAVGERGEEEVKRTLEELLRSGRLAHPSPQSATRLSAIPASLTGYHIESGRASDYDRLLQEASGE
jgi:transposase